VIHGPGAIDSGDAAALIASLRPGWVAIAGIMTRCAAEEHGLIHAWTGEPPSVALSRDPAAVLVNRGRTPESGRVFGELVAARVARPLIQLECIDRTVIAWNRAEGSGIAHRLGWMLEERNAENVPPVENRRTVRGCLPGDAVLINGLVIGRATADEIALVSDGTDLIAERGCVMKEHGVEKLRRRGPISLPDAWCTAGTLRSTTPGKPGRRRIRCGRILVLDHDACELYRRLSDDVCGILAIGDDTTAVALHIGAHLGLPVLGVTDGDGDELVAGTGAAGSLVVRATGERDDDLGRLVAEGYDGRPIRWETFVAYALAILGSRVRVIA
jgi:hypothetical protein